MPVRLADLRARVGALPPPAVDAALAAALFMEVLAEAATSGASWPARLAVAGPAAFVALGLLLRRRDAVAAMAAAALGLGLTAALEAPVREGLVGLSFAYLFVVYSLAVAENGRRLVGGVALAELAVVVAALAERSAFLGHVAYASGVFVAAPVFAGRMLHSRVRLSRALREKAERSERERTVRAEEAAADERARIAGELHDVVAHALGAMTIQAAAARRLATKDAARAAGALEAIETAGRDALGELRTLLEVLRAGDAEDRALAPQPGLAFLADLAERATAAGMPTELESHGERPEFLPTGIDLTGYRVVQEALSEALEQGGARHARVVVRFDRDGLEIEVHDDGARGAGRHLLGLRERVHLYGGHVDAGRRRSGGHLVRARLPLEGVPA